MQADPQTEIPECKDKKTISAVKLVVAFNLNPCGFPIATESLHGNYIGEFDLF